MIFVKNSIFIILLVGMTVILKYLPIEKDNIQVLKNILWDYGRYVSISISNYMVVIIPQV